MDPHLQQDDEEALVQLSARRPFPPVDLPAPEEAASLEPFSAPEGYRTLSGSSVFRDEDFVRPPRTGAQRGWRRWLNEASSGLVTLGPSSAEAESAVLLERVQAPLAGCRRIAVVSRKGGVGKTSVTLGLGHTFATLRADRVVALDANPDAGTLGYRIPGSPGKTLTDLLADADGIIRYSEVRSYTAQAPSRLEVISSDDDARITRGVGEHEYQTAIDVLERHYNLLLTDTGTDITHSIMQGILGAADQIVVVAVPSLDGARAASKTFDWLEQNGHGYLVRGAVVVLNGVRRRMLVDLDRLAAHFAGRSRAVVPLPWDRHLEAGAQTSLDDLHPATRAAYVQLAAAIADGFGPAR